MKYIDADCIKRVIRRLADSYQDTFTDDLCKKLIDFIDGAMPSIPPQSSLQKEVDLEKEVKDYIYTLPHFPHSRTGIPGGWKCSWSEEEVIKIVKHFFELWLAQKGE